MKFIAVNGSPRKDGNTAVLLQKALRGAEVNGAETELINLYDLNFKGCISCFACKRKGSQCNGICAVRDDLTGVLKNILSSDCLLLGSPIYLANVTGMMRSFLERLVFPNLSYNTGNRSVFPGGIATGFIYTMNLSEEQMKQAGYDFIYEKNNSYLQIFNSDPEILICADTYQFKDYSMYDCSKFDEKHKAQVHKEQFPVDCQKAYDLGVRLVKAKLK